MSNYNSNKGNRSANGNRSSASNRGRNSQRRPSNGRRPHAESTTVRAGNSSFGRPQLYEIHPTSIKMIQKGNPWVTLDQFSEQFNPHEKFIVSSNNRRPFALLLHDPRHPTVRARLWSKEGNFGNQIKNFKNDFIKRCTEAFKQRKEQNIIEKRSNFYLLFGEADGVPGLFIQLLNDQVLVQSYSYFWDKYPDIIIQTVTSQLKHLFDMEITRENIWMQSRVSSQEFKAPAKCLAPNISFYRIVIDEFGCKYKISLGEFYDIGIYTDMSAIRENIKGLFEESKSVLNLYSYTGAFSIFALKNGADDVVSVDLSEKYLEMLQTNLELNEDLDASKHTTMAMSVEDSFKEFKKTKKTFDLIINDPPSSSTDGSKRTSALKEYEKQLPLLAKMLNENGKMVLFLNTHKVTKRKFQDVLEKVIKDKKLDLRVSKFLSLNSDCPSMPKFAEGSYLKGFIIEKISKNDK